MRALFRSLERAGVRYLVISGQASVLYGAALFSQDLDLWIEPTGRNVRAFLEALASVRGRVHKLTPPLTLRNLRRGHGFHFLIPGGPAGDLYVDVMGRPPRVGSFREARRRSATLTSPWGRVPVVGVEDLGSGSCGASAPRGA